MRLYPTLLGIVLVVAGISLWQFGTRNVDVQVQRVETGTIPEWLMSTIADRTVKEMPLDSGVTVSAHCSVMVPVLNEKSDIQVFVMDSKNYDLWSKGTRDLRYTTKLQGVGDFNFSFTTTSQGLYRIVFDNGDSPYKKSIACSADYSKQLTVTEKQKDYTLNRVGLVIVLAGATISIYGASRRAVISWK